MKENHRLEMVAKTNQSAIEDQIEELQKRHNLLENERKTKIELSSQHIRSNKDTIRKLSEENNKLRTDISNIKSSRKQTQNPIDEAIKQKAKSNAIRSENARKEQLVEELKSQLQTLHGSVKSSEDLKSSNERKMRVVENRIDKAMIKLNEAQSIKKTYEGILRRLKDERISFDKELRELEAQLETKKKESEELLLLSHDAAHAKELAQAELHKFEQAVLEERNQRDREVMEKKQLVQQRIEMNQRMEKMAQEAAAAAQQAPKKTESTTPIPEAKSLDTTGRIDLPDEASKLEQKISEYEDAFARLREITGVSDVNEIIEKFVSQQNTYDTLLKRTDEEQAKLDSLEAEHKKLKIQMDDLKYSSGTAGRRLAGDNMEIAVQESEHRLERAKERFEKLARVLMDINAGVSHLHARLADIKLDNRSAPDISQVTEDTIEEVLNLCDQKIVKMLETMGPSAFTDLPAPSPAPQVAPDFLKMKANEIDDVDYDAAIQENDAFFNRKQMKLGSQQFVEKMRKKQALGDS